MSSHSVFSIHVKNMFLQQLKRNVSKSMQRHKIFFCSICILNAIGFIVLTVICLNNSISLISINTECMLMLTEQSLCQWRLDLLGVVSFFFSARQDVVLCSFQPSKKSTPTYSITKIAPVKLEGGRGGQNHIKTINR